MADDALSSSPRSARSSVLELLGHKRLVSSAAFSRDGARIATASHDGTARIWDTDDGREVVRLEGHSGHVNWVSFSPDDSALVTTSGDGTARVWDPADGRELVRFSGHSGPVWEVAYSPDGHRVATAGSDGTARIWDAADGRELLALQGHASAVTGVAFSPDGTRIATSGSDRTARTWDAGDGRALRVFRGHRGAVLRVAYEPNGERIATVSGDGTARIWDTGAGRELQRLEGHTDMVIRIAYAPDGQRIATASDDGTARIWDIAGGNELNRIEQPPRKVVSVSFVSDGGRVVTSTNQGDTGILYIAVGISDNVRMVDDEPASIATDALGRVGLARFMAKHLRGLFGEHPGTSFFVHLDGPWGSGKSTLLKLLKEEISSGTATRWLVVNFDAWRESKLDAPAFSLLGALRRSIRASLPPVRRLWFGVRERWRMLGATNLLVVGIATPILAVLMFIALRHRPDITDAGRWIGVATGIITVGAFGWSVFRATSQILAWESIDRVAALIRRERDPMGAVAAHVKWLLERTNRPVLFLIDDLDRCEPSFVVELLDIVQTVMRAAPSASHGRIRGEADSADGHSDRDGKLRQGMFVFVVAADGRWIRKSYEIIHESFSDSIASPGKGLGYLFLEKLFQLTITMPLLSPIRQQRYLASILRSRGGETGTADRDVRERIERSTTEREILDVLSEATPEQRLATAPQAMSRFAERSVHMTTEHALESYADLIAPNPRSIKRFVMDYAAMRGARTAEGNLVGIEQLALWTVVRSRWPALADFLAHSPHHVAAIGAAGEQLKDVPDDLRPLFVDESEEVRDVLAFSGDRLSADDIRSCTGMEIVPTRSRPS